MTDTHLQPADDTAFEQADRVIWEKLLEYKVLDEILKPLQIVPMWVKINFVGNKTSPRVYAYAKTTMTDAEAIDQGYALNPDWLRVRSELRPLVMKYQVNRTAQVTKDETRRPLALPSPEEQKAIVEEVVDEVISLKAQRDKAAAEQAAALKRVRQKRSG